MKKFAKVCLIIVAAMFAAGLLFCGIATVMGAGYGTLRQMARNGEFSFNFGNVNWEDEDWIDDEEIDSTEGAENLAYAEYQSSAVKNLDVNVEAAQVIWQESDDENLITVELERGRKQYYSATLSGDTLEIEYDFNSHHSVKLKQHRIVISIPKNMKFDMVDLEIGAAEMIITAPSIQCQNLELQVGAGELTAEKFEVSDTMDISIGAGVIDINNGTYKNVLLECGMGTLKLKGKLEGDISGDCGMGSLLIELDGNREDYNYNLSCGMGTLKMNGTDYAAVGGSHSETNENAIGTIQLDCGMGTLELNIQ